MKKKELQQLWNFSTKAIHISLIKHNDVNTISDMRMRLMMMHNIIREELFKKNNKKIIDNIGE